MLELVVCNVTMIADSQLNQTRTVVSVGDVSGYRLPGGPAPREAGQLLVEHLLELVRCEPRHALVSLELLKLEETPIKVLQGLRSTHMKSILSYKQ